MKKDKKPFGGICSSSLTIAVLLILVACYGCYYYVHGIARLARIEPSIWVTELEDQGDTFKSYIRFIDSTTVETLDVGYDDSFIQKCEYEYHGEEWAPFFGGMYFKPQGVTLPRRLPSGAYAVSGVMKCKSAAFIAPYEIDAEWIDEPDLVGGKYNATFIFCGDSMTLDDTQTYEKVEEIPQEVVERMKEADW